MTNNEIIEQLNLTQSERVDNFEQRINQVRKILDETVENLQISSKITDLSKRRKLLYRYLSKKEADFVLEVLEKFRKRAISITEHDIDDLDNARSSSERNICTDFDMSRLLVAVLRSKCLRKYLKKTTTSVEPITEKFIANFIQFREIVNRRFALTGTDQTVREKELKTAFAENQYLTTKITELVEVLSRQEADYDREHNDYQVVYNELSENLRQLDEKFNFDLQQLIHESENSMMRLTINAETIQKELEEDVEQLQQQYDDVIDKHLKDEKSSRIALSKIETQLHNWIEKYDKDMTEKLSEFEALQDEYNQEMDEIHQLEDKLAAQFDEYTRLMQEKHDEEEQIFQEALDRFVQNRAARIIQRFWRAYLARKRAAARRKKSKKPKKPKRK